MSDDVEAPQMQTFFASFSKRFFTSLRQTLLDETQRFLPGAVSASPKRDTGYKISPANSNTDEPARE